jgi:hypothetical protein
MELIFIPLKIVRNGMATSTFYCFTSNLINPNMTRMISTTPAVNPNRNLTSFKNLPVFDLTGEDLSMIACKMNPIPATRNIVQVMTKRTTIPGVLINGQS